MEHPRIKQIRRFLEIGHRIKNIMSKNDFNPFIVGNKRTADKREMLLKKCADLMRGQALAASQSNQPDSRLFLSEDNTEWLLEQVDSILDVEEWSLDDMSRLCAIMFFLLGTPDDTQVVEDDI